MGWLESIPIIGKLFSDTTDIIKKVVVDKDRQNAILGNLNQIKLQIDKELYIKELETKTIGWIDAMHKMGRQILAAMSIIATVILLLLSIEITPTVALIIGGPTTAYTLIKRAGK